MSAEQARRLGGLYLTLQGLAASLWWLLLAAHPAMRHFFLRAGSADATLLGISSSRTSIGYIGGSFAAAYGIWRRRPWAWPAFSAPTPGRQHTRLFTA